MTKRDPDKQTFFERQLDEARSRFRAVGSDNEILAWAKEDALTPTEFRMLVEAAPDTAEFVLLARAVLKRPGDYPAALQEFREKLMALHDQVMGTSHAASEEKAIAHAGMTIIRWWAACDKLLLDGLPDADRRWSRLASPAFQARMASGFVDRVIESGTDHGAAGALRALFAPLARGEEPAPGAIEAVLAHYPDLDHVTDAVLRALEDRFLLGAGYRRALLTLPAVAEYLNTTARHASQRQAADVPMSEYQIIREDWEPAAANDVPAEVESRDLLRSIEIEFLPSLPPRMGRDFEAVKLRDNAAADVARATGRSRAAVSKNLAAATKLLKVFLAARG